MAEESERPCDERQREREAKETERHTERAERGTLHHLHREREKLTDAAKRQSAPRVELIYAELILILINEETSEVKT